MSLRLSQTASAAAILVAAGCQCTLAQTPAILVIDVDNVLQYFEDTSDLSKFAMDPNVTTPVLPRNLNAGLVIGDIVAVNGQPAKGTMTRNARTVFLSTTPTPGQAVADTVRNAVTAFTFEILKTDLTRSAPLWPTDSLEALLHPEFLRPSRRLVSRLWAAWEHLLGLGDRWARWRFRKAPLSGQLP